MVVKYQSLIWVRFHETTRHVDQNLDPQHVPRFEPCESPLSKKMDAAPNFMTKHVAVCAPLYFHYGIAV